MRELDAAGRGRGERIPALTELFELIRAAASRSANLETKLSPNAADETAIPRRSRASSSDACSQRRFCRAHTLQSFDWRTLVEAKRLAPNIKTACLTTEGGNGER